MYISDTLTPPSCLRLCCLGLCCLQNLGQHALHGVPTRYPRPNVCGEKGLALSFKDGRGGHVRPNVAHRQTGAPTGG